jgi:hypothetical protein
VWPELLGERVQPKPVIPGFDLVSHLLYLTIDDRPGFTGHTSSYSSFSTRPLGVVCVPACCVYCWSWGWRVAALGQRRPCALVPRVWFCCHLGRCYAPPMSTTNQDPRLGGKPHPGLTRSRKAGEGYLLAESAAQPRMLQGAWSAGMSVPWSQVPSWSTVFVEYRSPPFSMPQGMNNSKQRAQIHRKNPVTRCTITQ